MPRKSLSSMILNAVFDILRAALCVVTLCFVVPRWGRHCRWGTMQARGALKCLPWTSAGTFIGVMSTLKVLMLPSILWALGGLEEFLKGLRLWFAEANREPPDPKTLKDRLRRRRIKRLRRAMLVAASLPVFSQAQGTHGLTTYEKTANVAQAHAERVRESLHLTEDENFIEGTDGMLTVCDSGASTFASSNILDFVPGTFVKTEGTQMMEGIAGGLKILGRGLVRFEVIDHHGHAQVIQCEGALIENLPCRLMPPQKIMKTNDDGHFRINGESAAWCSNTIKDASKLR